MQRLRETVNQALEAGHFVEARSAVESLWKGQPTGATANFVLSCAAKWQGFFPAKPMRVYFLRSFTLEPLVPLLRAGAALHGIEITAGVGSFGTYTQNIFAAGSELYQFQPDAAILAVQTRDIAPRLWEDFEPGPASQDAVAEALNQFAGLIQAFRRHSRANLIVHTLEEPLYPSFGVLDAQREDSQAAAIQEINIGLRKLASEWPGVYLLDYDRLVATHGRRQWHDEQKWLTARMPIRAEYQNAMAAEWLRFLVPLAGRGAKVLVTDLDNTLWGGVLGEEGRAGIQIGLEYPGAHYRALQQTMSDLSRRGIVLAVCSKNDAPEALAAIEEHPGMLLRTKHFSAFRINWREKFENLEEIAAELNVGLDAIAFVDDNPVECDRVRRELPDVTVIQLPAEPAAYAAAVRSHPIFERLSLSQEDTVRTELYQAQRERRQAQNQATTMEEFFESLRQELDLLPVPPEQEQRVAQLTGKTNQFNLTTRRYSAQEIHDMARLDGYRVLQAGVRDRFGDNGVVGVVILRERGEISEIDTLLLSCRVIGRTVETAILALLIEDCRERGVHWIEGWFFPTKKNGPAKDFFREHQFELMETREECSRWRINVRQSTIACPPWIRAAYRKESVLSESLAS